MAAMRLPQRPQGLLAWRKYLGLSRQQVAVRCHTVGVPIDPVTIRRLETGTSDSTSVRKAQALARVFSQAAGVEVTIEDLFPVTFDQGREVHGPIPSLAA